MNFVLMCTGQTRKKFFCIKPQYNKTIKHKGRFVILHRIGQKNKKKPRVRICMQTNYDYD